MADYEIPDYSPSGYNPLEQTGIASAPPSPNTGGAGIYNADQMNADMGNADQSGYVLVTTTTQPALAGDYPVFLQLPTSISSASATTIRQGDTSPLRMAYLQDAQGRGIDLTNCTVQYAHYTKKTTDSNGNLVPSTLVFQANAVVLYPKQGLVQYVWQVGDTAVAGKKDEEWMVTNTLTGQVFTVPGNANSLVTVLAHGG